MTSPFPLTPKEYSNSGGARCAAMGFLQRIRCCLDRGGRLEYVAAWRAVPGSNASRFASGSPPGQQDQFFTIPPAARHLRWHAVPTRPGDAKHAQDLLESI